MSLELILEEFIEESEADLTKKDLGDFLAAAEGDGKISVEPEIEIGGIDDGGKDPEIMPFGSKKMNEGNIAANVGDDGTVLLDEELTHALQSFNKSLKNVDATVETAKKDIFLAEGWWKEVRKEITDRKFQKAKFNIENFVHDLDPLVDEQEALADALKQLVKQL